MEGINSSEQNIIDNETHAVLYGFWHAMHAIPVDEIGENVLLVRLKC